MRAELVGMLCNRTATEAVCKLGQENRRMRAHIMWLGKGHP